MKLLLTRKINGEKSVTRNTTVVEKQEIAENLNKYFTKIGPNLAPKISSERGKTFNKL